LQERLAEALSHRLAPDDREFRAKALPRFASGSPPAGNVVQGARFRHLHDVGVRHVVSILGVATTTTPIADKRVMPTAAGLLGVAAAERVTRMRVKPCDADAPGAPNAFGTEAMGTNAAVALVVPVPPTSATTESAAFRELSATPIDTVEND
jgi:hypothetical protein